MYSAVLTLHSWVRWVALVAVVGATLAAVTGRVRGERSPADRWGLVAMTALDIQMLLGLLLYLAVSPNMRPILMNFGAAMKDPEDVRCSGSRSAPRGQEDQPPLKLRRSAEALAKGKKPCSFTPRRNSVP